MKFLVIRQERAKSQELNGSLNACTASKSEKYLSLLYKIKNAGFNWFLLLFFIFVYGLAFSYVTILRIYALQTYAYDLGNYNQALYTTLTGKGFLFYTADLNSNPTGSVFGVHVSIILLLLLPFYAIYPAPETLLIIQSFVLALAAIPIFLLAKLKLKSEKSGLLFALAYLLNPLLHGINWYDFHPEAFLPLPFLFACYFFEKREWPKYFICITLILSVLDKAAFLVVCISLFGFLSLNYRRLINFKKIKYSPITRDPEFNKLIVNIVTVTIGILWLFFTTMAVRSFNQFNVYVGSGSLLYWKELGAKSLIDIPRIILFDPLSVFKALQFEWSQKLQYILITFMPILFLPIFAPKALILIIPSMTVFLLSNFTPYYQIGTQYPSFILPGVFYAGILGAKNLIEFMASRRYQFKSSLEVRLNVIKLANKVGMLVFGVSVMCFLLTSTLMPWAPVWRWTYPLLHYGFPKLSAHTQSAVDLIKSIPLNSSVLTQNSLFPLVSSRENAYVIPCSVFYPAGTSFSMLLRSILEKVDYVIVDVTLNPVEASLVLSSEDVKRDFGVYASVDGVLLLKRGFKGEPVIFESYKITCDWRSVTPIGESKVVKDGDKMVLKYENKINDDFWNGPYLHLPPGEYAAIISLKVERNLEGEILSLPVYLYPSIIWIQPIGDNQTGYHLNFQVNETFKKIELASTTIFGKNFSKIGCYEKFQLNFTATTFGVYELPGMNVKTSDAVYFGEIQIVQVKPYSHYDDAIIINVPFNTR